MRDRKTERHNPFFQGGYLSQEHLERYRFACQLLEPGSRVLDAACGWGYGTMLLDERGCDVIGLDIDGRQISENRKRWDSDLFLTGDVTELPFEDNSFDAVVAFEVIEHCVEESKILTSLSRVIKPGGILICSTPNYRYTRCVGPRLDWHKKEYSPEGFFSLLESYFCNVEKRAQYINWRDRAGDFAWWSMHSLGVKIAKKLHVRNIVRSWLRKWREGKSRKSLSVKDRNSLIGSIPVDTRHKVVPYQGDKLLRIMICIAEKGAH